MDRKKCGGGRRGRIKNLALIIVTFYHGSLSCLGSSHHMVLQGGAKAGPAEWRPSWSASAFTRHINAQPDSPKGGHFSKKRCRKSFEIKKYCILKSKYQHCSIYVFSRMSADCLKVCQTVFNVGKMTLGGQNSFESGPTRKDLLFAKKKIESPLSKKLLQPSPRPDSQSNQPVFQTGNFWPPCTVTSPPHQTGSNVQNAHISLGL